MSGMVKPSVVLFDVYNTLLEIRTAEHDPAVWTHLARFLGYQGLQLDGELLHATFLAHVRARQVASGEAYPEIDLVSIFQQLLRAHGLAHPAAVAVYVTHLLRTLSIRRLRLFPDTLRTLHALHGMFPLGLITDAQRVFVEPELAQVGVTGYFAVRIISSDYGFRKPDPRLFGTALERLGVGPEEAIYVGDNGFRDVYGAQRAGLRGVLVQRQGRQEAAGRWRAELTVSTLDELVAWLRH